MEGFTSWALPLHDEDQLAVTLRSLCPRPSKFTSFPNNAHKNAMFFLGFALDVPPKKVKTKNMSVLHSGLFS